jgi:acyl dehydratase
MVFSACTERPTVVRYYEDLAVGDVFECGEYTITEAEIVEFASEFDPQPYHTDPEAASDTFFGELVASGAHTFSLTVRMTVTNFLDDLENMGGWGMDELRYHQPVRPGDTLSFEIEVVEKSTSDSHPERGTVDFERRVSDEDGEDVLSVVSHNLVRRRDPAPESSD